MRNLNLFLVAAAVLFLSACQTRPHKAFESVRGGMSKSEVLAAIGGPVRTQRWQGRDRWQYVFYGHPEGDLVREVHFENGISTYVGPAIKPAISAENQDRINDSLNRAADLRDFESATNEASGLKIQRFESIEDSKDSTEPAPQ